MFAPFAQEKGWHYNARFNVYQKVRGNVFVYVTQMLFGSYMVQLYIRGARNMGTCQLEARTSNSSNLNRMFEMGEEWLGLYQSGDLSQIHQDHFSILNPEGVWRKESHLKKFWID